MIKIYYEKGVKCFYNGQKYAKEEIKFINYFEYSIQGLKNENFMNKNSNFYERNIPFVSVSLGNLNNKRNKELLNNKGFRQNIGLKLATACQKYYQNKP